MAKPKFPKKNSVSNLKEPVSTTGIQAPVFETSVAPPAAPVAVSAPETVKAESKKPEPKKVVKKPEIVKTEARPNLVPINLEDEIRRLAYLFSERRGFEPGHESEDWLNAEREVRQRYHQLSVSASA